MKVNVLFKISMIALLSLAGCKGRKHTDENVKNSVPVVVLQVNKTSANSEILVSGNIEGKKTVKLGFLVGGKINFIAIEEGESIRTGQLFASLDPENYSIAKDMADANLAQTQDEYNRLGLMYDRKSLSESDFSKITNALKVAKAQQRLQAKNLSDTRLYSTINGVLLKKGAEVGEIISMGMPLFVVSDISWVKVNASVPESEIHQLRVSDEAKVYISSLDSIFPGKITEIGSMAEATTRTFSVKVELKNPQLLIRPGMTAEIRLITNQIIQHSTIPIEAVLHDIDNSSYVYIADMAKKQAFKRKISLGHISGNNVEVISGLNPGESVVISGQRNLSNGSSITLK